MDMFTNIGDIKQAKSGARIGNRTFLLNSKDSEYAKKKLKEAKDETEKWVNGYSWDQKSDDEK